MKYGKLINDALEIKEFENGMEVGGSLTEQQAVKEGYKPVCEVEQPSDAEFCVYREYDVCFVQIWKRADEEVQEDEIWTADSGVMPKYSDLQRLTRDIAMVSENINSIKLSNKEKNEVKKLYPKWEDYISKSLDTFISYRFEGIAREYFSRLARQGQLHGVLNIGIFYYGDPDARRNGESDVALRFEDGYDIFEVKHLEGRMSSLLIDEERRKILDIQYFKPRNIGFISSSGFEIITDDAIYIDGNDIYEGRVPSR